MLAGAQGKLNAPALQSEIRCLQPHRRSLTISDHGEIAEILRVYGAFLKGLRGVW